MAVTVGVTAAATTAIVVTVATTIVRRRRHHHRCHTQRMVCVVFAACCVRTCVRARQFVLSSKQINPCSRCVYDLSILICPTMCRTHRNKCYCLACTICWNPIVCLCCVFFFAILHLNHCMNFAAYQNHVRVCVSVGWWYECMSRIYDYVFGRTETKLLNAFTYC